LLVSWLIAISTLELEGDASLDSAARSRLARASRQLAEDLIRSAAAAGYRLDRLTASIPR
jgi:hypothetical protein